jgi:O-antigen/teichoic acid export membrane protein
MNLDLKKATILTVIATIIQYSLNIIIQPILRVLELKALNIEYLGIISWASEFIGIFATLGGMIWPGIVYSLYESMENKNYSESKSLLLLFKKYSHFLGFAIMLLGIFIAPFLKYIIPESVNLKYTLLIYFVFVFRSSITYLIVGGIPMLIADSRRYIESILYIISYIVGFIIQLFGLLIYNIEIFLLGLALETLFLAILRYFISLKLYDKEIKAIPIDITKKKKKKIFDLALSGVILNIKNVVIDSTDQTFIITFLGAASSAVYATYQLVFQTIYYLIALIGSRIVPSFGHLDARENKKDFMPHFKQLMFFQLFVIWLFAVGFNLCCSPLVCIWMGKDFLIPKIILFLLIISFMQKTIIWISGVMIESFGLNPKTKKISLVEAGLNIILSVLFIGPFKLGISGVLLGTIIANFLTGFWKLPKILFHDKFHESTWIYYKILLKFSLPGFISYIFTSLISIIFFKWFIMIGILAEFFVKGIFSVLSTCLFYYIILKNTKEFKFLKKQIKQLHKNK